MNDSGSVRETSPSSRNSITQDIDPTGSPPPLLLPQSTSNHTAAANTNKKKPAIRHAEKRRTSTCRFADRVAQLSVDHYKKTIPLDKRPSQTCIATIVAHCTLYKCNDGVGDAENVNDNDVDHDGNNTRGAGMLWVLSMGVGTKFLSESILRREIENECIDGYGSRVRDMHAEVLARRAFRRQLTLEIQEDLRFPEEQERRRKRKSNRILVRSLDKDSRIRYKLRSDITLHMYTSSTPCGNATLKRFCKMYKEKFRDDLGPDEWPDSAHEPPPGHSIKLGEFSLLVKKDSSNNNQQTISNTTNSSENNRNKPSVRLDTTSLQTLTAPQSSSNIDTDTDYGTKIKRTRFEEDQPSGPHTNTTSQAQPSQQQKSSKRRAKPWPATLSDDWVPPGTTIVGFRNKGSIHTCSDKICRWNYLGIQGSLLAGLMKEPLYMSTLTVGRKLSGPVCRRAICCRLDTRCRLPKLAMPLNQDAGTHNNTMDDSHNNVNSVEYRVNHPAVMGTSVYLDGGVVDTSNVKEKGQDVRFHSSFVWAWCAGSSKHSDIMKTNSKTYYDGILECIESSTGLLANLSDEQQAKHDIDKGLYGTVAPQVSTKELTSAFLKVYREAATNINNSCDASGQSGSASSNDSNIDGKLTLEGSNLGSWANDINALSALRKVKKTCSPIHEEIKDRLFAEHRVLSQWRRRGYEDICIEVTD
uniref:A to I editase domain-containing protein n=1 Tax=Pseudo-nitzschia australis TaxID=44445 RepID=A0A6U9WLL4_9STRA